MPTARKKLSLCTSFAFVVSWYERHLSTEFSIFKIVASGKSTCSFTRSNYSSPVAVENFFSCWDICFFSELFFFTCVPWTGLQTRDKSRNVAFSLACHRCCSPEQVLEVVNMIHQLLFLHPCAVVSTNRLLLVNNFLFSDVVSIYRADAVAVAFNNLTWCTGTCSDTQGWVMHRRSSDRTPKTLYSRYGDFYIHRVQIINLIYNQW